MKRPGPERWTPTHIATLIRRMNEPGVTRAELIAEFRFVSDDQLRISCSRFRGQGYAIPDVPPRAADGGRRIVDLSDAPSRAVASREIDWHDLPPEKLPNLEQGLDIATYWLLRWGVAVDWHRSSAGDMVSIGGRLTNQAVLVDRYFDERARRLRP